MPEPAAHLSLLLNTVTLPVAVMPMARVHCPPISRMAVVPGVVKWAPRAAVVISVT